MQVTGHLTTGYRGAGCSDNCRHGLRAVAVFRGKRQRSWPSITADQCVRLCKNRVWLASSIRQQRVARQIRAVFTVRAFAIVANGKARHHRDAVFLTDRNNLPHERADLSVVNLFFVHGHAPVIFPMPTALDGHQ